MPTDNYGKAKLPKLVIPSFCERSEATKPPLRRFSAPFAPSAVILVGQVFTAALTCLSESMYFASMSFFSIHSILVVRRA